MLDQRGGTVRQYRPNSSCGHSFCRWLFGAVFLAAGFAAAVSFAAGFFCRRRLCKRRFLRRRFYASEGFRLPEGLLWPAAFFSQGSLRSLCLPSFRSGVLRDGRGQILPRRPSGLRQLRRGFTLLALLPRPRAGRGLDLLTHPRPALGGSLPVLLSGQNFVAIWYADFTSLPRPDPAGFVAVFNDLLQAADILAHAGVVGRIIHCAAEFNAPIRLGLADKIADFSGTSNRQVLLDTPRISATTPNDQQLMTNPHIKHESLHTTVLSVLRFR